MRPNGENDTIFHKAKYFQHVFKIWNHFAYDINVGSTFVDCLLQISHFGLLCEDLKQTITTIWNDKTS